VWYNIVDYLINLIGGVNLRMTNKEALRPVSGLEYDKIEQLPEEQWHNYVLDMDEFIDVFPDIELQLKSDLAERKYSGVRESLVKICEMLGRICTEDKLTVECRSQISAIDGGETEHDNLRMFVESFAQRISMLSIDMQVAVHVKARFAQERSIPEGIRPVILAVDDSVMFLNTLKKLLKDSPYELHCLTSGEGALQFLAANIKQPSMILLDIMMPGMDGYELARRITSKGNTAPILFITANSGREYVDKAVELGAVGLLVKPIRIRQLLKKIKEFV
jgi:CheY-like chemotaxis protein